ncbi:transposase [Rhodococcus opacus]|uniref:transposase n=1 Tax=Rhodococcus opacus TaxID=37919 RepID=UPI000AB31960|nr:transposase [Rhodococcus opacus]
MRVDPWDTGFVDLDGDQGLLGQKEGRTTAAVVEWLGERTPEFREAIEYVAIDPAAVYAAATRTEGLLPNATLVVDHFHLVKLANDTVTKVRRRVTWELKDRRGGKIEPSVGQPTSVAHRTGTTLGQELREDVERDRG